jgi:CubicO group peptidase (beta-lactamase class C family)
MRYLFIFGLFDVFVSSQNLAAQTGKIAALENLHSSLHAQKKFNGAVVVGEKGKIIYSKGFGFADFSDSTLFTPFTPSDGGSNAKTLTAAAVLLLAEKGKLRLQDSVQRYLPGYPYPNTAVLNLITHSTGGLPDYDYYFEKIADSSVLTTQGIVDILSQYRPSLPYSPNTNFYYDSPGFDVAAAVVEKVSGLSYQQFLNRHFFTPLQMRSSFVRPARLAQWKGKRTKGYRIQADSLRLHDIADREGFYGGSNIWFSATDLYTWGTSFYHRPVVAKKVMAKITKPVSIQNKPSAVRLGAWYSGKNPHAFYYWGDLFGFYSWVYWDKERRFTIAFVTNTATPQWLRPQLTSALIDIMEGNQPMEINEPEADSVNKQNVEAMTGFYEVDGYEQVEIISKGNGPLLRLPTGMEYKMVQVDSKTFYVPGLEPWISFRYLKENKFQQLFWSATNLRAVGQRILVSK